jgi:hypothetical protein
VELGSWADWVNAVGTYFAVGGAAFAGVVAHRSYKTQQEATKRQLAQYEKEEQKRLLTERQSQANMVAMWIFRGRYGWHVQGVNTSDLPIYGLVLHLYSENPLFSVAIERGTQGPSGPETSKKLTNAARHVLEKHDVLEMDPDDLRLAIAFTDMAGVRWHRDHRGFLHEVESSFDFHDAGERLIDREVPWDGELRASE